jgi:hypothetical protein
MVNTAIRPVPAMDNARPIRASAKRFLGKKYGKTLRRDKYKKITIYNNTLPGGLMNLIELFAI